MRGARRHGMHGKGHARQELVENTGKVLARYKREHLAPGEMEHITVPRMLLEKAQGAVRICVEEELR